MVILEVKDLWVKYKKEEKYTLKNINIKIKKGECIVILGVNGAGKSTLLYTIMGAKSYEKGEIKINGSMSGYIENITFIPELTGEENIKYIAKIYGKKVKKEEVEKELKNVGLYKKRKTKVYKYSTGMKKRLAFAMNILLDAEIMILDEPLENLDPAERIKLIKKIKNLNKSEKTIIVTTHVLSEAEKLAGKIIILHNGEIISNTEIKGDKKYIFKYKINEETYSKEINEKEIVKEIQNIEEKNGEIIKIVKITNDIENLFFKVIKEF